MKEFIKDKREAISLVMYTALIGVVVYWLIIPLMAKINTVRDQIQENNIKQEVKSQNVRELPKIEQQFKMVSEDKQFFDVLIDKDNAVPLIEKLESLAESTNNSISIEVQEAATTQKTANGKAKNQAQENAITSSLPSTNYLQLKVTLGGNLDSIGRYIYMLERFDYFNDIIGVQINNKAENKKNDFSASMFEEKKNDNIQESEGKMEAVLDLVFYAK